jgi:hypothetical protein
MRALINFKRGFYQTIDLYFRRLRRSISAWNGVSCGADPSGLHAGWFTCWILFSHSAHYRLLSHLTNSANDVTKTKCGLKFARNTAMLADHTDCAVPVSSSPGLTTIATDSHWRHYDTSASAVEYAVTNIWAGKMLRLLVCCLSTFQVANRRFNYAELKETKYSAVTLRTFRFNVALEETTSTDHNVTTH